MSWACDLVAEMFRILKKTIFDLIIRGQVLDRVKKCPRILYGVNLRLKSFSATGSNAVINFASKSIVDLQK